MASLNSCIRNNKIKFSKEEMDYIRPFLSNVTNAKDMLNALKNIYASFEDDYNDVADFVRNNKGFAPYLPAFLDIDEGILNGLPDLEPGNPNRARADSLGLTGSMYLLAANGLSITEIRDQIHKINRWDIADSEVKAIERSLGIPERGTPEFTVWQEEVANKPYQLNSHLLNNGLNIASRNSPKATIATMDNIRDLFKTSTVKLLTPFSYIKDFFNNIPEDFFNKNNMNVGETQVFQVYKQFHDTFFADPNNYFFEEIKTLIQGSPKIGNNVWVTSILENPILQFFTLSSNKKKSLELDENIKGIISFATFKWLYENNRSLLNRSEEDIKSAFNMNDSDLIRSDVLSFLIEAGDLKSNIARHIGADIYKMLGISINKELADQIDPHIKEQFINSLGLIAINNLTTSKNTKPMFLEIPMSASDKQKMLGIKEESNEVVNFIRFAPDKETDLLLEFFDENREYVNGFLEKFAVGFDKAIKPKLNPTPYESQTKIRKGTGQPLTDFTEKVINKLSNLAFGVDKQVHSLLTAMTKEDYLEAMGYVKDLDAEDSPIMRIRKASVRGKNLTLEMAYDNYLAYTEALPDLDTPTFFDWFVSSNNRLNMAINGVTPQSEKLHRHSIKPVQQLNRTIPAGQSQLRDNVIRAIAHAFGHEIDKFSLEEAEAFVKEMNSDERVVTLRKLQSRVRLSEQEKAEQSRLIKEIVASVGEASAFDGLAALIAYKPRGEFTTNITIETDSTSSGVSLGSVVLSTKYDEQLLAAAGVHTDGTTDQKEWKDNPDNFDNYERTTLEMVKQLPNYNQSLISKLQKFVPNLIESLGEGLGDKVSSAGRKFTKNPVTILMYGAGLKKVLENKSYAVIDSIYDKIQEAIINNDQDAIKQIQSDLNAIFQANPFIDLVNQAEGDVSPGIAALANKKFSFQFPKTGLRNFQFNGFEQFLISTAFNVTYGKALESTIETLFGDILDVRQNLLQIVGDTFKMYKVAYDAEVEKYKKEKHAKIFGDKAPLTSVPLNEADYQAIRDRVEHFAPTFKTILSAGRKDGVRAIKTGKESMGEAYAAKVRYTVDRTLSGKYVLDNEGNPYWDQKAGSSNKSSDTVSSTVEVPVEPGAFGMTSLIQDLESSVMQNLIMQLDGILPVHDAINGSTENPENTVNEHNKQFAKMTELANIVGEVINTHNQVSAEYKKAKFPEIEYTEKELANLEKALEEMPLMAKANQTMRNDLYNEGAPTTVTNTYYPNSYHTVSAPVSENVDSLIKEIVADLDNISDPNAFGSQPNPSEFNPTHTETLTAENTIKQFDALSGKGNKTENPSHAQHLRNWISHIANNVMTASEQLTLQMQEKGAATWGRISGKLIDMNIAIDPIMNSLAMSAQEVFAHEHIHNITTYAIDNNPFLRSQARKLFKAAKDQITVEQLLVREDPNDFTSPIKIAVSLDAEKQAAQERYDYIFNSPNGIYEFIAYGNTNEQFRNLLKNVKVTKTRENPSGTIEGWIASWFEQAVRFVTDMYYKLSNQNAADQLEILTLRMSKINDRNNAIGRSFTKLVDMGNPYLTKAAVNFVFQPLEAYSKKKNPNFVSKGLNVGFKYYYDTETRQHFNRLAKQTVNRFDEITGGYLSPVLNLLKHLPKEMAGLTEFNRKFYELLRKSKHFVDQASQKELESVYNTLKEVYINGYSEEESTAILRSMVQTDLIDLIGKYNPANIEKLMTNDDYLNTEIQKTIKELEKFGPNKNNYMKQARSLGSIMATGIATTYNAMLNPHNIAKGYYDSNFKAFGNVADAELIISRLKSLYAIKYTDPAHKAKFVEVHNREYASNSVRNGIVVTLEMLETHRQDSLERLFGGQKALMQSGYHSQILDPNVGIKFSTDPDDKELKNAGYKKVEKLGTDKNFSAGPGQMYMYVSNHGGLSTYVKTIVSLTSDKVSGTTLTDIAKLQQSNNPALDARNNAKAMDKKIQGLIKANQDPANNEAVMVPVLDPSGAIVNYRYLMTEESKSKYLSKDTRFDYVIGSMFANRLNKNNSLVINRETAAALREDFDKYYKNDAKEDFVYIGPDAKPEYAEHWALLPRDLQEQLNGLFTKEVQANIHKDAKGFYIQEQYVDLVLGQRKLSLANVELFKNKAGIIKTIESIVQDIVGVAKNNIVIKSTVLINNIVSNFLVGYLNGVPMRYMALQKAAATKALDEFIKNEHEKRKLELQVAGRSLTPAQRKAMLGKIAQLQSDMDNSIVKPLLDQGLFSSIIEDLDIQTAYDKFNTQARISSWFEEKIGKKTPDSIRKGYSYAYLTKENPVFQFLDKTTKYSDFVARFAVYQHLTKEQGKSKEEALETVIRAFVNYDAPTSKELQWLNDHGFAVFTKYAIRIQKPLWMLFQGRPSNALGLQILQSILGINIPDITDSFTFAPGVAQLTNPISFTIDGMGLWGLQLVPNQIDAIDALIP